MLISVAMSRILSIENIVKDFFPNFYNFVKYFCFRSHSAIHRDPQLKMDACRALRTRGSLLVPQGLLAPTIQPFQIFSFSSTFSSSTLYYSSSIFFFSLSLLAPTILHFQIYYSYSSVFPLINLLPPNLAQIPVQPSQTHFLTSSTRPFW